MATQNDDLDLQTFQIYHEDEQDVKDAQEKEAAEAAAKDPKNKSKEKKGLFSFSLGKSKDKNEKVTPPKKQQAAPTKNNKKVAPKAFKSKKQSSSSGDAVKGILLGFILLAIFIAVDQLGFLG